MSDADTSRTISAVVAGEPYLELPDNLYIPPDALEICLEEFEGPLDLLTYLIKQQNLNILDIPIRLITEQYVEYIEKMDQLHMELAAEYLVMAAMLAEIKSSMLLPKQATNLDDEEDPRAELVRRLQEYERFKLAAEDIDALPRLQRDNYVASADLVSDCSDKPLAAVDMELLVGAFKGVLQRLDMSSHHKVQRDELSIRDRMATIMQTLTGSCDSLVSFDRFFVLSEGRQGVVVSFMAILELAKENLIVIMQSSSLELVWIKAVVRE